MPKRIIPFGDRIIVRRRRIGENATKQGLIELPDSVKERPTDLADVVYVPNHTFADKELIANSEAIIKNFSKQMLEGSVEAFKALLSFHAYLKLKMLKPGMTVFINKYVGMDFHDNENSGMLCVILSEDICGVIENVES